MAPILGIWASSKLPAVNAGSFESIATATVGAGGSSTITFSSIPSTYTHLQLRSMALCSSNDSTGSKMTFNSDTTANYAAHYLYGNGSSAAAGGNGANQFVYGSFNASNTYPVVAVTDILDYANTSKYKTTRTLTGSDWNGSGSVWLFSGLWMSTSAISTISISPNSGNFNQYSSFALYGIRS